MKVLTMNGHSNVQRFKNTKNDYIKPRFLSNTTQHKKVESNTKNVGYSGGYRIPNLNYDWTRGDLKAPGLNNLGNTCFMNSVCQCMTYTLGLTNQMIDSSNDGHRKVCTNKKNGFCGACFWENHIKSVWKLKGALSPNLLFKNLRIINSAQRPGRQHDAHEFYINFQDNIEKAYDLDINQMKKINPSLNLENPIKKIFLGFMVSQIKCMKCGYCSNTKEPFYDIGIDIQSNNLSQNQKNYFQVETLSGSNKYNCSGCKNKVNAEKRYYIKDFPNNLVIHFKRFDMYARKVTKPVTYPSLINFSEFAFPEDKVNKQDHQNYELYGVVVHIGGTLNGGHYIAYCKSPDNNWYLCDDSRVANASNNGISSGAYMLYYRKVQRVSKTDIKLTELTSNTPSRKTSEVLQNTTSTNSRKPSKDNINVEIKKKVNPYHKARKESAEEKLDENYKPKSDSWITTDSLLQKRKAGLTGINKERYEAQLEKNKEKIELEKKITKFDKTKYPNWATLSKEEKKKLRKKDAKGQKKLELKKDRKRLKQDHWASKQDDKVIVSQAFNPKKITFQKEFVDDVKSSFSLFDQKIAMKNTTNKSLFPIFKQPEVTSNDQEPGLFKSKSMMFEQKIAQQPKTEQFENSKSKKITKASKRKIIEHLKKSQKFLEKVFDKLKNKVNLNSGESHSKILIKLKKLKENLKKRQLSRRTKNSKKALQNSKYDNDNQKNGENSGQNGDVIEKTQRKNSAEKGFKDQKNFQGKQGSSEVVTLTRTISSNIDSRKTTSAIETGYY